MAEAYVEVIGNIARTQYRAFIYKISRKALYGASIHRASCRALYRALCRALYRALCRALYRALCRALGVVILIFINKVYIKLLKLLKL